MGGLWREKAGNEDTGELVATWQSDWRQNQRFCSTIGSVYYTSPSCLSLGEPYHLT